MLLCAFSCQAQNGPSSPSVSLNWTQSTTAGVTANCVYRGSAAGKYDMPAIFCSTAPITSYKDTTVWRSMTYHYAVTAQIGSTEGGFSNDVIASVPIAPAAPALTTPSAITELRPGDKPVLSAKVVWQTQ